MIGRQATTALALAGLGALAAVVALDRYRVHITDALMGAYAEGFDAGAGQDSSGWAHLSASTGGRRVDGFGYVRLHTAAPRSTPPEE